MQKSTPTINPPHTPHLISVKTTKTDVRIICFSSSELWYNTATYEQFVRRLFVLSETFELQSAYQPEGDQPEAIKKIVEGIKRGEKHQTLLGATGTGKTFTISNVIQK